VSQHVAVDTSVAVPLLVATAVPHSAVFAWARDRTLHLSGHALVETYSVLTRLPGDIRVAPADAVRLIDANFDPPLVLDEQTAASVPQMLAARGIAGGAAYDALVALAAAQHRVPLATRDSRARDTYRMIGVELQIVP